ncbi:hypothetical protein GCM10028795_19580 [Lysobacter olei]
MKNANMTDRETLELDANTLNPSGSATNRIQAAAITASVKIRTSANHSTNSARLFRLASATLI